MPDPTERLVAVIVLFVLILVAELVRVVVVINLLIFSLFHSINKRHCNFPKILQFLQDGNSSAKEMIEK
jgi:hypothetical protein